MKAGTHISTTRETERGVPQGSILGPVLLLLYINDLPLNITGSKIMSFADDTNILVSKENINKLQYKINRVMNELQTLCKLKSCS
jgi:retron-type reverse transcriptase